MRRHYYTVFRRSITQLSELPRHVDVDEAKIAKLIITTFALP